MTHGKKLIEVGLPLVAINKASARDSFAHGQKAMDSPVAVRAHEISHDRSSGPRLHRNIRGWQPLVVFTVMIAIQSNVASALLRARLVGAPHRALPFPGRQNHRERYVEMLTALVHEWLADAR